MDRLLIIADDLSGAAETAVQLVRRGTPAVVTTNASSGEHRISGVPFPVVAVDTETRHVSPAAAARHVEAAVNEALAGAFTHFYKKTDSTLRGNIGAELAVLMTASGRQQLVFIPAYPRAGRYTLNGIQFVGSQMLHESAIALDPLEPVTTSSVAEIIKRQAAVTVMSVRPETLGAVIEKGYSGVLVCDAASDNDMAMIAAVLDQHDALRCIAGPAGFVGFAGDRLDLPIRSLVVPCIEAALIIVSGSLHPKSLAQVACALENGAHGILVPPQIALSQDINDFMPILWDRADKAGGRDIVVHTVLERRQHVDYLEYGMKLRLLPKEIYQRISTNLALIGAVLVCRLRSSILCAFGGDVAIALLRALGCDGLQPLAEASPGVVLSQMRGGCNERYLITKPGGFGNETIIEDIKILLRGDGGVKSEKGEMH